MKRTTEYDVNLTINGEIENADLIICGWHYQNDFDQFDHNMSSSPKHALISEVKRLLAQDQVPRLELQVYKKIINRFGATIKFGENYSTDDIFKKPEPIVSDVEIPEDFGIHLSQTIKDEIDEETDGFVKGTNAKHYLPGNAFEEIDKEYVQERNKEYRRLMAAFDDFTKDYSETDKKVLKRNFKAKLQHELTQLVKEKAAQEDHYYFLETYYYPLLTAKDSGKTSVLRDLYSRRDNPEQLIERISSLKICNIDPYVNYETFHSNIEYSDMVEEIRQNEELYNVSKKVVDRVKDAKTNVRLVVIGYEQIWKKLFRNAYMHHIGNGYLLMERKLNQHTYCLRRATDGLTSKNIYPVVISAADYEDLKNDLF
ncbi:hypothetical protein [Companilactobacillus farciminis]|uniref:hypothetical protein n=1 Tax=Companilactobacillus farciminis TaxID=1612 RepID=UPI0019169CB1|nr:hypothetical protein [Companilactobacillus farciminis]